MTTPCVVHPNRPNKVTGYVQVKIGGKNFYVHRLAWEAVHGPIPDGLTVDHSCFNRACINVEHMELTTRGENARRGRRWKAQQEAGTCHRGHPRSVYGRRKSNGKWWCTECQSLNRGCVRRYKKG